MGYRVGIDVGGTFTDITLLDENTGKVEVMKVTTTVEDQSRGVIEILKKMGEKYSLEGINYIIHGTTIATNALLERKGARTAFITTEGFRDTLYIGRQTRPHIYDFWAKKPEPVVPRCDAYEAPERIDHKGKVIKPLNEEKLKETLKEIYKKDFESIAISLLHSYINSEHEIRIRDIIKDKIPEINVTISSEILPEYREYERASTITINAYLQPIIKKYMEQLELKKKELKIKPRIHIMQSNGGIINIENASQQSVRTILSGPAGGALISSYIARQVGDTNLITFDMGGTSLDICLAKNGKLKITNEVEIEGLPIRIPMIDIHTIGAGGGSIAWIDAGGILQVGPESAGAIPGPACYNKGGTKPTVTDANVALGYIDPKYFLGGEMQVKLELARGVIKKEIADFYNIEIERAADSIIDVLNSNMIRGMRVISVEKGHDPREFALVAFGGAGPLHAAKIARDLKMSKVIVPINPGNASALGFLLADVRYDYVQTYITSEADLKVDKYLEIFNKMKKRAFRDLKSEGFKESEIELMYSVDMRYEGQSSELNIPIDFRVEKEEDIVKIVFKFHNYHKEYYGYQMEAENVIFVNFRLSGIGKIPKYSPKPMELGGIDPKEALKGYREIYLEENWIKSPIYERKKLMPGNIIKGPAIIEEYGSTTLILPGMEAEIDQFSNIILKFE